MHEQERKNIMKPPRKRRYDNIIDERFSIVGAGFHDAHHALRRTFGERIMESNNLIEALQALKFTTGYRDNGDIAAIWYDGDDDETRESTLQALSPYIDDGSFIIWQARGGRKWRNEFVEGRMLTSRPSTVWVYDQDAEEDNTGEQ